MPFVLRPFSEQDYEAVVAITNTIYPEYSESAEEWRRDDQLFDETKYVRKRYVALDEVTRQVVGYGSITHISVTFHPQKFWMNLMVHPDWQRKGIGSLLYDRLADDLQELNATTLWAGVREDKTDALAFLQKRGFLEKKREWELRLFTAEADLSPFLPVMDKVKAQGIAITTLAEERQHDPECLRKLYELNNAVCADIPWPDPYTPRSFEEFKRRWLEDPSFLPDACFIAKHGERYIGLSNLWRSEAEPERLYHGLTGVLREYRRQGIATALKVKTIEYAKLKGYQIVITWNDSTNAGILSLNEKLCFRRQVGWITMEKAFKV